MPELFGMKYLYLWHWRSDRGEMFALFEDYDNAQKYRDANEDDPAMIFNEILSLPVIDA